MSEAPAERFDVVIVGGGPGGLAVSQQLGVRGVSNVILERGDQAGWMWGQVYDSLRLHPGKHLSSLPGMGFPSHTSLFPTRSEFAAYLESYADKFQLPLRTGAAATGLRGSNGGWTVETKSTLYQSLAVVVATGIMSSPVAPDFPGAGSYPGLIFHSTEYRRPDERLGRSTLVVGIGNSAAEIASELANAGMDVTLSVRSGANVIPRSVLGIPSQYLGWSMSWLPGLVQRRIVRATGLMGNILNRKSQALPRKRHFDGCQDVPVIGRAIVDHVSAGRVSVAPGVAELSRSIVRFTDGSEWSGDSIILATGYQAAIEWMGDYGARDECGFGSRRDRVRSANHPDLYYVGHTYDGRGGLYNIRIDARRIGRLIAHSHSQW